MPSRIDTLTYTGFGLLGAGTTAEFAKESTGKALECLQIAEKEAVVNVMDINLLFGYIPGIEINLTGVIAILGTIMMVRAARKGNRDKKRRIESESFPDSVVRDPDKRI